MREAEGLSSRGHWLGAPKSSSEGASPAGGWLRPNPIMLSLVKVLSMEGRVIRVLGLDAIDGTPVLDIKPWERGVRRPRCGSG
ncbi:MAG TPA: hypothetical protein ENG69_05525 [Candidatus Korarchaeota archaeon]|nr:hypothetical protein [Candidatus Korarchaeota archaeon]